MSVRIQAIGIIASIFVIVSMAAYTVVIELDKDISNQLINRDQIKAKGEDILQIET